MLRLAIATASIAIGSVLAPPAQANVGLTIGDVEIGIFDRYRTEPDYGWRTEVLTVRPQRRRFSLRRGFLCNEDGDCQEVLIPSRRRYFAPRERGFYADW